MCTAFCYDEHVPAARKAWMSLDDVIRALDKFRFHYGNEFVDFMGGEPTLHPAILDITAHAASIGLRPTVITHGMHLARPERAAAFGQAGIHDFLVSVHATGETAGAIHGRGPDAGDRYLLRRRGRGQRPVHAALSASRLRAARLYRLPASLRSPRMGLQLLV
jgi:MoaA/NifB/PqqE/SkfB family radical SAM enzyme